MTRRSEPQTLVALPGRAKAAVQSREKSSGAAGIIGAKIRTEGAGGRQEGNGFICNSGTNEPALLDEGRGARRRSACRAEDNPDSESCLTGSIATKPAGSHTAGSLFFRRLRNGIQARTPGRRNGPSGSSRWIAASIVSGLASGFSAHSHEIECVLAVVVVHGNDSAAGSIRAVRPTLPPDP